MCNNILIISLEQDYVASLSQELCNISQTTSVENMKCTSSRKFEYVDCFLFNLSVNDWYWIDERNIKE